MGKVQVNLDELWAGFYPRVEPLEPEVWKEWEQDGAACRIVRYQVGVFQRRASKGRGVLRLSTGRDQTPRTSITGTPTVITSRNSCGLKSI